MAKHYWKVIHDILPTDLEMQLNTLEIKGWEVMEVQTYDNLKVIENEFDEGKLVRLAEFLGLEPYREWLDKALELINSALDRDKNNPVVLSYLGEYYFQKNEYDTSKESQDALSFYTNFVKEDKVWDDKLPSSTVAFAIGYVAVMLVLHQL